MTTPTHYERQVMQRLRGAGWVSAIDMPDMPRTIQRLLEKGWIERRESGDGVAYRLTDLGLEAKKAPVSVRRQERPR